MKDIVKQSKKNILKLDYIFPILILFIIINIVINPSKYNAVALKGLEVWVKVLLPSLFPFFVLTKIFSSTKFSRQITKLFTPITKKMYKCPSVSGYIFFMSIITGYPVGSKLVADNYISGILTRNEAVKTLSFSANSGPMFILGSVAIGMFCNKTLGFIIYISHIIGSILNGLLYRNYESKKCKNIRHKEKIKNQKLKNNEFDNQADLHDKSNYCIEFSNTTKLKNENNNIINLDCNTEKNANFNEDNNYKEENTTNRQEDNLKNNISFSDSINSSISSILLIGGAICFTFVLIEVILSSPAYLGFLNLLGGLGLDTSIVSAIFSGIFEITKGCLMLSSLPISFNVACMLCTFIISFGGISTFLQALAFTKGIVPTKVFILEKITHAILSSLVCALILVVV